MKTWLKDVFGPAFAFSLYIGLVFLVLVGIPLGILGVFFEAWWIFAFAFSLGFLLGIVGGLFSRKEKNSIDVPIGCSLFSIIPGGALVGLPIAIRFGLVEGVIAVVAIAVLVFLFALGCSHLPSPPEAAKE